MSEAMWDFFGALVAGAIWAALCVVIVGAVNLLSGTDLFHLPTAAVVAFGLSGGEYHNNRRRERRGLK